MPPFSLVDSDGMFRYELFQWSERHPGTVILESNPGDKVNRLSYCFVNPKEIVQTSRQEEIQASLERVQRAVAEGFWAGGFLSYEAGAAFEKNLPVRSPDVPLLWFGIYDDPITVDRTIGRASGPGTALRDLTRSVAGFRGGPRNVDGHLLFRPSQSETHYLDAFTRVQRYIEAGDTYQVNLTFKLLTQFSASAAAEYDRMRRAQRVAYGAFLNLGAFQILSCSPELFFRQAGKAITLKPMKGTVARGRTLAEDEARLLWLTRSEKNRAENLMIVDLLRNDIGRVARPGTIHVKRFFDIERYETVFQATSTIQATLKEGTSTIDILRGLFPSGSVTGAPKIRTMQIIHELEAEPRGVYTGSIGFIAPTRKAVFNVAIRTLVVDRNASMAEIGVGSGVVHDSQGKEEYKECLLKARFLEQPAEEFALLETMRWDPEGGWFLLKNHLKRLKDSATYFGYRFSRSNVVEELSRLERVFKHSRTRRSHRVRLLMTRNGQVTMRHAMLKPVPGHALVRFSDVMTDATDRFLFHKTTLRKVYDAELQRAEDEGFYDAIFRNKEGEITEGSRSTVVVRRGGFLLTPPLVCGLLPGTFRSYLLTRRKNRAREARLFPDDILTAEEVYCCNALRGMIRVRLREHSLSA